MASILVCGVFGNLNQLPYGGGQTSARRFVALLKKLDFDVRVFNRHPRVGSKFKRFFLYLSDIPSFIGTLIKHRKTAPVVIVIVYCCSMLPFFLLFARLAMLFGLKTWLYLKGGFTEDNLKKESAYCQKTFIRIAGQAQCILSEGEEIIPFIRNLSKQSIVEYVPNFVEDRLLLSDNPVRDCNSIKLVYSGRIDKKKNVLTVIAVYELLREKNFPCSLAIIGAGDTKYEIIVNDAIEHSKYSDGIRRIEHIPQEELHQELKNYHFYIFPSIEPREGHPNSLNDAMSCGVVPIVSDNNYQDLIVGDNYLVINGYNPNDYADRIAELWISGRFHDYSDYVFNRVKNNYTQTRVEDVLNHLKSSKLFKREQ